MSSINTAAAPTSATTAAGRAAVTPVKTAASLSPHTAKNSSATATGMSQQSPTPSPLPSSALTATSTAAATAVTAASPQPSVAAAQLERLLTRIESIFGSATASSSASAAD